MARRGRPRLNRVTLCTLCHRAIKSFPSYRKRRNTRSRLCRVCWNITNAIRSAWIIREPVGFTCYFKPLVGRYVVRVAGGRPIYRARLMLECALGRSLAADEVAHHVNEDKTDDRPENLEALLRAEHTRHHRPTDHREYSR